MTASRKDFAFAVLASFLSSVSSITGVGVAKTLGAFTLGSLSQLLGGLMVFFSIKASNERVDWQKLRLHLRDFTFLVVLRCIIGMSLFAYGLGLTDAIKAIFFTKVEPYFVLAWSWLLRGEKIKASHAFLLLVHISGAVLLSTGGNLAGLGKSQAGDFLIIAAMGMLSLSYLPAKKLSIELGAKATNALTQVVGGLALLPLAVLFAPPAKVLALEVTGWVFLAIHSVLYNLVSQTLWYASLKTVQGWMVSALRALGPLLAAPVAFFLFGETLEPMQLVGAAIVLLTSLLMAREHFKK
ncbi:MAG TPA: DMT family transporter [archaeon]|nr:DMT family transporter [archaeon]